MGAFVLFRVARTGTERQMGVRLERETEDQPLVSWKFEFDSIGTGNKQNNNSLYVLENTCVFVRS